VALKEVLIEQIEKNHKNISFYEEHLSTLPRGSLHSITVKGSKQYYLKYYNDRGKRREISVEKQEFEIIRNQLQMRDQIERWIQELNEDIKVAEKTLKNIIREEK